MKPKWRKKKRKIFGKKNRTNGWSYERKGQDKEEEEKGAASDANMGVSYI